MNNFLTILIDEGISLNIPDTWKTEEGDQGEYAFSNEDGTVDLTVIFFKFGKNDPFSAEEMLESITANFIEPDLSHLESLIESHEFPDLPDIKELLEKYPPKLEVAASPLIKTEKYFAKHLQMEYQTMLVALVPVQTDQGKIVAYLMFRAEDATAYESEKETMEQILNGIEIKA